MSMVMTEQKDETRIRQAFADWAEGVRARDVDLIMAHYAPDVRAFDAIGKLEFRGADAYRAHWEACLKMCPGEMIFEVDDPEVVTGGEIALSHGLARCGAIGDDGVEKSSWMRATVAWRRSGDRWLIVHEHWSAPFDPESGKALFDLQP